MDRRRWRLNRRAELHWRRLDDEWVVFDAASCDTHRLDTVSAAALMCLEAEAHDLDGLSALLAETLGLASDPDLMLKLEGLIEQLSDLDLIEPDTP